jgi:hypothetical protein
MVTLDRADLADLSEITAESYRNLSPNQVLAMAAGELAKIKGRKDDNLFNALARISEDPDAAKKLQPSRQALSRSAATPAA